MAQVPIVVVGQGDLKLPLPRARRAGRARLGAARSAGAAARPLVMLSGFSTVATSATVRAVARSPWRAARTTANQCLRWRCRMRSTSRSRCCSTRSRATTSPIKIIMPHDDGARACAYLCVLLSWPAALIASGMMTRPFCHGTEPRGRRSMEASARPITPADGESHGPGYRLILCRLRERASHAGRSTACTANHLRLSDGRRNEERQTRGEKRKCKKPRDFIWEERHREVTDIQRRSQVRSVASQGHIFAMRSLVLPRLAGVGRAPRALLAHVRAAPRLPRPRLSRTLATALPGGWRQPEAAVAKGSRAAVMP